jgi:hypothetical protein
MMPLKSNEPGDDTTVVAHWENGFTWMAHPETTMRRASHALAVDGDVWLIDPLDAEGLDSALADLGRVAGVVVLTNSHGRHADRLAARHEVAIHLSDCFDREAHPVNGFDAPVEYFNDELAETGFELVWQKDGRGWKEGALYHPDRGTLVVPDALMTALFTGQEGRLEVLPFFRFSPPREGFEDLPVERILVGHGEPVLEDAQDALTTALDGAGGRAPTAIARSLPTLARQVYAELRS